MLRPPGGAWLSRGCAPALLEPGACLASGLIVGRSGPLRLLVHRAVDPGDVVERLLGLPASDVRRVHLHDAERRHVEVDLRILVVRVVAESERVDEAPVHAVAVPQVDQVTDVRGLHPLAAYAALLQPRMPAEPPDDPERAGSTLGAAHVRAAAELGDDQGTAGRPYVFAKAFREQRAVARRAV